MDIVEAERDPAVGDRLFVDAEMLAAQHEDEIHEPVTLIRVEVVELLVEPLDVEKLI